MTSITSTKNVPVPQTLTNNWQSRRLAEMVARQKLNDVKREWSEIQAKVEKEMFSALSPEESSTLHELLQKLQQ